MPAKSPTDKIIVTNAAALQKKYGVGNTGKIKAAIDALIAADKKRGLTTLFIPLDDTGVSKYKAKPVTKAADARQCKKAMDAVYKALTPAYVCILGSVDIVPHVPLVNPISSDGDALAPSDLPYACDKDYSTKIEDFLAPTRVVGRLPDITGGKDPTYLAGLLDTAAGAVSQPAAKYAAYLGVSAKVWHDSTSASVKNGFGNNSDMKDAPPNGPPWTALIGRLSHFFNCHGAPADPHFYGQQGNNYPIAHDAARLAGLKTGTVLAAECCYGAELYDPAKANGQAGMCNTYLAAAAYGFFGSSTIAYGPSSGNAQADLICQYFFEHVLAGASLGEATLMARQDYIKVLSVADPTDLKTLAQFNLMGDPSLHPVQATPAGQSVAAGSTSKAMIRAARLADPADVQAASRSLRRRHLAALGESLAMAIVSIVTRSKTSARGNVEKVLQSELRKANAKMRGIHSFAVKRPSIAGAKAFALAGGPGAVDSVHAAVGELPRGNSPCPQYYVVVARQQAGQLLLRHLFSR
jgi:hypothetical protein